MITDKNLRVSDAQSIVGAAGTYNSTDFINFNDIASSNRRRDVGMGETLYALFTVTTAPNNLATVEFQIELGTASSGTFTGTEVVTRTRAIEIANLAAGTQIILPIPAHSLTGTSSHAMRVKYVTVGSTASTTGAVTCDIILDEQHTGKHYASGFTA